MLRELLTHSLHCFEFVELTLNTKNLKIFQVSYVIQIKIPNFVPKLYIRAAVGAFTPRRKQDATIFYIRHNYLLHSNIHTMEEKRIYALMNNNPLKKETPRT